MTTDELKKIIQDIVTEAIKLNEKHTDERKIPVNYACIFAQNQDEYNEMLDAAQHIGSVVDDTEMGPIFYITPLLSDGGVLKLLKIRCPDSKRLERGDADFTVINYDMFKKTILTNLVSVLLKGLKWK